MSARIQNALTFVGLVLFLILGFYFGVEPESATANGFGDLIRAFAKEPQTRLIVATILIDLLTGVIAAYRTRTFDGERFAAFLGSNVIPYLFGYMLLWFLSFFGFAAYLSPVLNNLLADFGFGVVMTSLSMSIIANVRRANAGTPAS